MLHVLGPIHDLIEPAELLGGQDTGQPPPLLGGSKLAVLPHPLGDVPPSLVVQPLLPHEPGDPGDQRALLDFAFPFCDPQLGGFSVIFVAPGWLGGA